MTSSLSNYLHNMNNTQSSALTKAMGLYGQWGMSSAFDFLEIYDKLKKKKEREEQKGDSVPRVIELPESESPSRLNLLLMYPGDVRHIISSIARSRRYFKNSTEPFPEIHFYLLEPNAEILARDLILLAIFFHLEIPIRQKSNLFLEIYGNLFIQKRTKQLIAQLAKELIPLVTQTTSLATSSSIVLLLKQLISFDMFNFRDHDTLQTSLSHYFTPTFEFKIKDYFNTRQRALYEDRYDQRQALYDWDYHSNYKKKSSIIHIKQYKTWRESGIAYEFGDQVYNEANPTFIAYTEGVMKSGSKKGERQEVLGYWGDMVDAPYVGFGINSDSNNNQYAEGLYDILNKNTGTEQHRHHAVEVALYNLYSYLWELETGQPYQMMKAHDIYSGLGREYKKIGQSYQIEDLLEDIGKDPNDNDEEEKEKKSNENKDEQNSEKVTNDTDASDKKDTEGSSKPKAQQKEQTIDNNLLGIENALDILQNLQETLQHIHIHPIIASNTDLLTKSKFKNMFHGIFVSNRYTAILKEGEQFQQLFQQQQQSSSSSSFENILAVETLKFLIPVNQEVKDEYNKKIDGFMKTMSFKTFSEPPVFIRRRDEKDVEDDIVFYHK